MTALPPRPASAFERMYGPPPAQPGTSVGLMRYFEARLATVTRLLDEAWPAAWSWDCWARRFAGYRTSDGEFRTRFADIPVERLRDVVQKLWAGSLLWLLDVWVHSKLDYAFSEPERNTASFDAFVEGLVRAAATSDSVLVSLWPPKYSALETRRMEAHLAYVDLRPDVLEDEDEEATTTELIGST